MSSVPPNVVGPILQSGSMQKQASRVLENERQQQDAATESAGRLRDKLEVVGETDIDTQVHNESEGAGSQGKEHPQGQDAPQDEQDAPQGITRDQDGQLHVVLEA